MDPHPKRRHVPLPQLPERKLHRLLAHLERLRLPITAASPILRLESRLPLPQLHFQSGLLPALLSPQPQALTHKRHGNKRSIRVTMGKCRVLRLLRYPMKRQRQSSPLSLFGQWQYPGPTQCRVSHPQLCPLKPQRQPSPRFVIPQRGCLWSVGPKPQR